MCSSAVGVFANQLQYIYWFCYFKIQIDSIAPWANNIMDGMSFPLYLKPVIIFINAQALFSIVMTPTSSYEILWLWFTYSHVAFLLSWYAFIPFIIPPRTHIFRFNKCFASFTRIFCLMVLCASGQQGVFRSCIIFFLNVYNWYMNLTTKTVRCQSNQVSLGKYSEVN